MALPIAGGKGLVEGQDRLLPQNKHGCVGDGAGQVLRFASIMPAAGQDRFIGRMRRSRGEGGRTCRRQMGFPSHERSPSDLGQCVDTALDPDKPAIHVPLQDFRRVGYAPLHFAKAPGSRGQGCRTRQRLLAIGRHDRLTRNAACNGITLTPVVFGDDRGPAPRVTPRPPGHRLDDDVDPARSRHGQKAKAKEAAQLFDARVVLASATSARGAHRQPDFIAGRRAIDRLQDKIEREGQFQLTDDDGDRLALPKGNQITAADLALDVEAEPFEEALNREIKA
jgi:hypothetical protein